MEEKRGGGRGDLFSSQGNGEELEETFGFPTEQFASYQRMGLEA